MDKPSIIVRRDKAYKLCEECGRYRPLSEFDEAEEGWTDYCVGCSLIRTMRRREKARRWGADPDA
jgi:Pyruvate/2-oxoacid:ferredoxin oxidoreductase delta subunit